MIAQIKGHGMDATARFGGSAGGETSAQSAARAYQSDATASKYRGAQGLDPKFIKELEKLYGFDKPAYRALLAA